MNKQIEEMAIEDIVKAYPEISRPTAFGIISILKLGYGETKLPKDSVVNTPTIQCETYSQNDMVLISREEYEKLLKIKEQSSIKETNYFSNLFKLQKELEQVEKERDSAIDNCDRKSKETAEKAFEITKKIIDKKYAIETPWTRATLSSIINQIEKEFAKHFGVDIKE